jgi:hypothetical protein
MTSEKQIAANRRNAARSTGPTTAKGKARSSRNALRHGLSRRVSEGSTAPEIGEFALQLVGEEASPSELGLARAAAAAQMDIIRIRHERRKLLEALMIATTARAGSEAKEMTADRIARLDRYADRAESRRKTALAHLSRRRRLPVFG